MDDISVGLIEIILFSVMIGVEGCGKLGIFSREENW